MLQNLAASFAILGASIQKPFGKVLAYGALTNTRLASVQFPQIGFQARRTTAPYNYNNYELGAYPQHVPLPIHDLNKVSESLLLLQIETLDSKHRVVLGRLLRFLIS